MVAGDPKLYTGPRGKEIWLKGEGGESQLISTPHQLTPTIPSTGSLAFKNMRWLSQTPSDSLPFQMNTQLLFEHCLCR